MTRTELEKLVNERMHQPFISEGAALVSRARLYAIQKHGTQMYGENEPYSIHFDDVETVLIEFNHISSILRAAALLHDVLEDTPVTKEEFENVFPGMVSIIVEAVTNEPGKNRKERNIKTYPKIAKERYAIIVKLADRISNGRSAKRKGDSKYAMYKKEYPGFRAALYTSDIDSIPMWWELDRLFDFEGI